MKQTETKSGSVYPCGLSIKLEKDLLGKRLDAGEEHVLGYFDRIYIRPVRRWLDFSPKNTAPKGRKDAQGENESWPISAYPIKLLFPEEKRMEGLREFGLRYDRWRSPELEGEDAFSAFFAEYPCVTAILINLTDAFKGGFPRDACGEQLQGLAREVQKAGQRAGFGPERLAEAHCCILPSLGYSDYCILLAEKWWSVALPLMDELHRAAALPVKDTLRPKKERETPVPVLSTDYIMPIYHVANGRGAQEAELPNLTEAEAKNMRLSVRVNLWPGMDARRLRESGVEVYQTSGATDYILVMDEPEQIRRTLLGLIQGKKSETPFNVAVATEGTLCRRILSTGTLESQSGIRSDRLDAVIGNLRKVLDRYEGLLGKEHHRRQLSAVHQRVTVIENICGECHNLSLQIIMEGWLEDFTSCVDRCLERLKAGEGRIFGYLTGALEHFINEVGSFMADLSRSDCFFFESEQCNHPSVSSATALLIAYNRWQNSFVRDVLDEAEGRGDGSNYSFLVRSGGCDKTQTRNLFYFLSPEVTPDGARIREHIPLISQMSEMSLFDCSGAVFRMTHECMHFCGERHRQKRYEDIFDFISQYYGRILSRALLSETAYLRQPIAKLREMGILDAMGQVAQKDEKVLLEQKLAEAWKAAGEKLAKNICAELMREMKDAYDTANQKTAWTEQNYMSAYLTRWLQGCFSSAFSCYSYKNGTYRTSDLVRFLEKEHTAALVELYAAYDQAVRECKCDFNAFALERRRQQRGIDADRDGKGARGDRVLEPTVIHLLNQFLISGSYYADAGDPAVVGRTNGVTSVVKLTFECFSECFADLQACLRLDAELSDYILSFVFEIWDLDKALPSETLLSLRVPAVLQVCFPDQLENGHLSQTARKRIKTAVDGLGAHGLLEGRMNAEALADRIDQLLDGWKERPGEGAALVHYLKLCQTEYEGTGHGAMRKYADAFQALRGFRDGMEGENEAKMFYDLTTIGGAGQ